MTFDVQPAALKELAALLDRAKEDIDKSKQFLTKVEGFTGDGGRSPTTARNSNTCSSMPCAPARTR
jgi:hypothetical protein